MPMRHIACQRDGQAARLIRNKYRGRATRRPYVSAWTRVGTGPLPDLEQGIGILCPRVLGPGCGRPGPHTEGSGTRPGGPGRARGVLDLTWRSGLHVQGSGTFPWGSRPSADILEYIVFSGHVATLESSTWRGRVPFTMLLEIAAWV
jgi:hypothetical protein